jgi:hypothetical protein
MKVSLFRLPKRRVDAFCEDPKCTWSHHSFDHAVRGRYARGDNTSKQAITHAKETGHLVKVITTKWYQKPD